MVASGTPSLAQLIDPRTREGELWEPLPEGRLRCYACGHRCLIPPGQRGICKVRYNEGGRLRVPWGYVAGLQIDPVEKKPFFHAWPGAKALSFGMLGCDYHCQYCVMKTTIIATTAGLISIGKLFDAAETPSGLTGDSIRMSPDLEVYTHTGRARPVRALFRHQYSGTLIRLQPAYLLPLKLTPDHEVLTISEAELNAGFSPKFVRAGRLRHGDYLAVPRHLDLRYPTEYDVSVILRPLARRIRHPRHVISVSVLGRILAMSKAGLTSRQIGARVGKSGSHVRHLLSKLSRGTWSLADDSKPAEVLVEGSRVRLSKEHSPGMPVRLHLDEDFAALLGYYAAEGCVLRPKSRVHSASLIFSLGHHEEELAERISKLLIRVFAVQPRLSKRQTTLCVVVAKASVALLFESLCGTGSRRKRVPARLFAAPPSVAEAFLNAYIEGDGHRAKGGSTSASTVSRELALGVAWLALRTGRFPSIRAKRQAAESKIPGRTVRTAPYVYAIDWIADASKRRWLREDARYFYVPIRSVRRRHYDGWVYNLEVEEDHSYLAQLIATHNCQNALTSQALRDPTMGTPPQEVTPADVVAAAKRTGARILTSTYNEPLITSEWGVEIFKAGKAAGLVGSYVSNGNATPEVLDYIRPWVDLYKVDLKSFDDRHYRQLGGVLKTVLDGIRMVHARGFWLEVVTLTIPGFNDSDAELRDIAQFLVSISPDIPWHVTAFHPDYKMTDRGGTPAATLLRAAEIGVAAGLRYVYAGNLPGRVGPFEDTRCPGCGDAVVRRAGYRILEYRLQPGGRCPRCGAALAGRWD
jgi:pyruvate formate lyase activating enzyme